MPLHVHREICFSRVQVKQSQTPEMFETLYSRGVVQWFDNNILHLLVPTSVLIRALISY